MYNFFAKESPLTFVAKFPSNMQQSRWFPVHSRRNQICALLANHGLF
ncbi:MAG: hypothetical protein LH618_00330 [Saprospiraceae bacterium]|nr:hypothetical protein [Saprospiraceae bacterium]